MQSPTNHTPFPHLADQSQRLFQELSTQFQGRVFPSELLSKHTSLRVGGPALAYLYPKTIQDLLLVLELASQLELPWFVIGYGTNLLVSDRGFPGLVLDLSDCTNQIDFKEERVTAGSGVWLGELVRLTAERGLAGLEKLAGIPGGVGGALAMNAGAFGASISQHLVSLVILEPSGEVKHISVEEVNFGYRTAPGLVGKIVLEAHFSLIPSHPGTVIKEVEATITERFRRNVMTLPSAGSVFKNPPGFFAARLIEAIGGKGMREGGVEVSPLHANFIVNTRGGTAQDIINLIRKIRRRVKAEFGVTLQLELRTLGFEESLDDAGE